MAGEMFRFGFGDVVPAVTYEAAKTQLVAAEQSALQANLSLSTLQCQHDELDLKLKRMEEALYNKVSDLEGEVSRVRSEQDQLRKDYKALEARSADKDAEIASKDSQISSLTSTNDSLKNSLSEAKQALEDQQKATAEIDGHLNNAYADLEREQNAHSNALKAKDDVEAKQKETQVELQKLHIQLEQSQDTVKGLESRITDMHELERENEGLQDELDNVRKASEDHDRTILVKDARIQHLENQYQKALEGKLSAEAAATAASPTAEPPIFTTGADESLAAELDATSDTSDFGEGTSLFEQLDLSTITEVANIAPTEAPKLALSVVQGTSTTPVAPQTEKSTVAVQTDAPKLSYGIVQCIADIAQVEPKRMLIPAMTQTIVKGDLTKNVSITKTQQELLAERKRLSAAAIVPLSRSENRKAPVSTVYDIWPLTPQPTEALPTVTAGTQTEPVVEKAPEPIVTVVAPSQKKQGLDKWQLLALITSLLALWSYMQLQAWQTSNGYGGYNTSYQYSHGAFGRGRYIFGVFPVGFDIGHSWLSEQICRQTSSAIGAFEDWIGATPTPLY